MINHHVNRILQHKGYEALFSLGLIKLLTCRCPAAQAKHVRKLQHLQNYSCVNDQKKSDSFRFTLITNNAVILQNYLFFLPAPSVALPHIQSKKALKLCPALSHYLIWWVGTVLQKHTTSTSGGLLKIKAVWSSEALITIYQTT